MNYRKPFGLTLAVLSLTLAILACSFPLISGAPVISPVNPPAGVTIAPGAANPPPEIASPTNTSLPPVVHTMIPAEITLSGTKLFDADCAGTGAEHRAPYQDSYKLNRFERPFTQADMTYLPDIDILHFRITDDANWFYVFIELIGSNPNNNDLKPIFGVELDLDRDGHGDNLIWAQTPLSTQWTTDPVKVYADSNNDTGGASPERSDAPYPGNGYDTIIFDRGYGNDPDLAWVRIDPLNPTVVAFAFKRNLAGRSFMWGVWADAGLKDPTRFNYNDRYTEVEAGSSVRDNKNYPIQALYAMDNTCRSAFGFKPNGYEPLLCPTEEPKPSKGTPTAVPPPPPVPPPP